MYDVDGNGWIDPGEMTKIVKSIYKMMGPNQVKMDKFDTAERRADDIFRSDPGQKANCRMPHRLALGS